MLLAEQLTLIAHDKQTGNTAAGMLQCGLAGMLLVELSMHGKISTADPYTIEIIDDSSTGNDQLDQALRLAKIAKKGKLSDIIRDISRKSTQLPGRPDVELHTHILANLVERGLLYEKRVKVLGLFPTKRYPIRDELTHDQIIAEISPAYQDTRHFDVSIAALLLGLHSRQALHYLPEKISELSRIPREQLHEKRLKHELLQGTDWGTARQRTEIRAFCDAANRAPHVG